MHNIMTILSVAVCLVLAGALTLLRTVFIQVTSDDVMQDTKPAAILRALIRFQDSVLSALLTGYSLLILIAVMIVTQKLMPQMTALGLVIDSIAVLFFVMLLTYLLPRAYAVKRGAPLAVRLAAVIRILYYICLPFSAGIQWVGNQFTNTFKTSFAHMPYVFRTNDLQNILDRSSDAGVQNQKRVQQNLEQFADLTVQQIMQPFSGLEKLDSDLPMEEMVEKLLECHDQRVLIYQDTPENVIGILHMHLMMKAIALANGDINAIDMSSAISEPVYVSPYASVIDQINAFQNHGQHFALVRDRQNKLVGAVSLDSLIENLAAGLRA